MAQIIIRNIADDVKLRLQRLAKQHGRSMEEEARDILRNALYKDDSPSSGLGSDISSLFTCVGLDTDISELHGNSVQPVRLSE